MFTKFFDMFSGGRKKEAFNCCVIEAPRQQAKEIFVSKFGHDPENVTCECCGPDYFIDEFTSLADAMEDNLDSYITLTITKEQL